MPFAIPEVDIAPFRTGGAHARIDTARAFGQALENAGFVTITGHGVPEPLAQATYDAVHAFFAQDLETKLRSALPGRTKFHGYLPAGIESVAATLAGETPPDLCEALVFRALHRDAPDTIWPETPPGLRPTILAWYAELRRLAWDVMRLSALALDLPEDHFAPAYQDPQISLRLVNYPDQAEDPVPGQLRYGAHHDFGAMTILRQDSAPGGLQVADRQGDWHDLPNVPGSLVVNIGDMMARWTNGRWRSTLHRVINPPRAWAGTTQRLSLVTFAGPHEDTEVACLPTCTGPGNPPRHPPVKAGEYLRSRIAKSHGDE